MAFVAVMFITPDSLFIRLSNVDTWGLVFYRGIIPFVTVFVGMLFIYKSSFFKLLYGNSIYGVAYIFTFSITNITFVLSIQNTNVANTLVMIALAPMLSAIFGAIFLKEKPDRNTLIAIAITFLSVLYIFYDSVKLGNIFGDILGFITACGLAAGATIIRAGKSLNLVPSAVVGKLVVANRGLLREAVNTRLPPELVRKRRHVHALVQALQQRVVRRQVEPLVGGSRRHWR